MSLTSYPGHVNHLQPISELVNVIRVCIHDTTCKHMYTTCVYMLCTHMYTTCTHMYTTCTQHVHTCTQHVHTCIPLCGNNHFDFSSFSDISKLVIFFQNVK